MITESRSEDDEPDDVEPLVETEAPDETRSDADAKVLAELDRLQHARPSWIQAVVILLISVGLFSAGNWLQDGGRSLVSIVLILLFHELGHFVAMRVLGYQNVRMFFIPFFGAAVTGRNLNAPGWKKAVVALMGPLPGIVVGVVLGGIGMALRTPWMLHTGAMLTLLNGLQLVPFLPLDGGQIMQTTLFCRHPVLDVIFRGVAILVFLGLGLLTGSWIFLVIAGATFIALGSEWRIANAASEFRRQGLCAVPSKTNDISDEVALEILDEVRQPRWGTLNPKLQASMILRIFELLNSRPPGAAATLAFLFAHFATLVTAVVATIAFFVIQALIENPNQFAPPPPAAVAPR